MRRRKWSLTKYTFAASVRLVRVAQWTTSPVKTETSAAEDGWAPVRILLLLLQYPEKTRIFQAFLLKPFFERSIKWKVSNQTSFSFSFAGSFAGLSPWVGHFNSPELKRNQTLERSPAVTALREHCTQAVDRGTCTRASQNQPAFWLFSDPSTS